MCICVLAALPAAAPFSIGLRICGEVRSYTGSETRAEHTQRRPIEMGKRRCASIRHNIIEPGRKRGSWTRA